MNKAINKILTGVVLAALNTAAISADSGSVYGTHTTVDTGVESSIFYLIALVFFVLGLTILFVVKTLKAKTSIK